MIYTKCFLFYAIINYQFKKSEPKNVEKFVGAKSSRLKILSEWTGNVHFCTVSDITFLVGGPWKVLKNGFNFLYEPCHNLVICKHSCKVIVTMYIVLVIGKNIFEKMKWNEIIENKISEVGGECSITLSLYKRVKYMIAFWCSCLSLLRDKKSGVSNPLFRNKRGGRWS